jgi:tetratricopeptide (TPR) repeat protein/transcriptional regulator with XRE-family HTH domain
MKKTRQAVPNKLLREARKSRGWTQREVAERIGAPHPFIVNRWERGTNAPSSYYLQKLTDLFGKTIYELGLYEDEDQEDDNEPQEPDEIVAYRSIMGLLPRTHTSIILQREQAVAEIYEQLTQPETTALVITGISGVGKSTLAALVFNAVEERRKRGEQFFQGQSLWLRMDKNVSLLDTAYTIFAATGYKDENFHRYAPQQQALAFFHFLNTVDSPRFIVLDQFENLLDIQTGHPLTAHAGIAELIEAFSNHPCNCRLLLTSRIWPRELYNAPECYMKRYTLDGLETTEGLALLQKHGAKGSERDLREAVSKCGGHTYALVLLAALMREYTMDVAQVLKDPALWSEDIASEFLNHMLEGLQPVHHDILQAFAIYREPIPLEAVQTVLVDASQKQLLLSIRTLRLQHLLLALRDGHFQIHTLIVEHLKNRLHESNNLEELAHSKMLHARAAHYYLHRAVQSTSYKNQRRNVSHAYPLLEALWHLCQAGQWAEACTILEREQLFEDLHLNGGDAALLEVYQLLLPIERWQASDTQTLSIYLKMSQCYQVVGQLEQARHYGERALQISQTSSIKREEGLIYLHLGELLDDQGNKEKARMYREQALQISEELHDLSTQGHAHSALGWLFNTHYGDRAQARTHLEQALRLFQRCHDRSGEGWTLARLGTVARNDGDTQGAEDYYQQARTLFETIGEGTGAAWELGNLGELYGRMGRNQQAITYLEQAIQRFRELRAQRGIAWALYRLSVVYTTMYNHTQALTCLEEALTIFHEIGDQIGIGCVHSRLGITYHYLQQSERALQYFQQALTLLHKTGDLHAEAETLCNLGIYYKDQGVYLPALAAFWMAKHLFTQVHSFDVYEAEHQIETLRLEVGEQAFAHLLKQVEGQAEHIVEKALPAQ